LCRRRRSWAAIAAATTRT
jgi:NADPH:quinone reductase-like Zn-dependent oxidoreductase